MNKNRVLTIHLILLAVLAWIFLFYGLGTYSLKEPDEGRYAEIPREMVETGDFIVPHLNYVRYFEKPVLFYWAVAASYKAFGINEWSFRFPNALTALFCVVLSYFCCRRWFNERIALLSSLILITSFGFLGMARVVTIDMFFTLWLFLGLLGFYGYYRERLPIFIYGFYASLAFATLAKGPVALILSGVTVLAFLVAERNLSFLKQFKWVTGILLYLAITVPWFLAVSVKEREFFDFFFMDQHFLRFLTTKHKRTGSIVYFFPVLFGGMFPWSFFIPRAFITLWKNSEVRLFLIWSIVVFVFFSVSRSKLPPYILPIFPSVAIMIAFMFDTNWAKLFSRRSEVLACTAVFAATAAAVIVLYAGPVSVQQLLAGLSPETPKILSSLRFFALGIVVIAVIAAVLPIFSRFRTSSAVVSTLAGFSVAFTVMLMLNLSVVDRLNTTKRLSLAFNAEKKQCDYLVNYGSFEESLPFYTGRRVIMASYTGELEMGSQYTDAKDYFLTEDEFFRLLGSEKHIYVVAKAGRLKRLQEKGFTKLHIIAIQNERYLISN
jgi:hypothetical protein